MRIDVTTTVVVTGDSGYVMHRVTHKARSSQFDVEDEDKADRHLMHALGVNTKQVRATVKALFETILS